MEKRKNKALNKRLELEKEARRELGIHLETKRFNGVYAEYLRTPHWKKKREEAFVFYGRICLCGRTKGLQVHHRSYKNLGNEIVTDLSVLCDKCHQKTHSKGEIPINPEGNRKRKRKKQNKLDRKSHRTSGAHKQIMKEMKARNEEKQTPSASSLLEKMVRQNRRLS
jgi:5-methylcytosine-specific restriction endonuclease McrA